jgi:hypothetical protein
VFDVTPIRPVTPAAPRGLERVVELLPPGKVPGGFAREFCLIFAPEIKERFLTGEASDQAAESK